MTPIEELKYLASLTCEACKWRIAEGDTRSGLEMEVEDRIRRLNEQLEDRDSAPAPKSNKKYSDKYAENHRRISINGKSQWVHIDQLEQVPTPNSRTGYKWVLKKEGPLYNTDENPDETKSLSY